MVRQLGLAQRPPFPIDTYDEGGEIRVPHSYRQTPGNL